MLNTVEKSQDNYKNRPWLTFLVLVIFGTMVLAVCSILLGCGSDSAPGGAVKGKNAKATTDSKAKTTGAAIPLLSDKEGTGPHKLKISPEPPAAKRLELLPGITREKLEAKLAADRAKFDPKQMEAFPGAGITQVELEAKLAADRAKFDPKQMEAFPGAGITQVELEAKLAADRAKFDPRSIPLPPIVTPKKNRS